MAARAAARAVELDPFDANHHTVLVSSLVCAGDVDAANQQAWRAAATCSARELGVDAPVDVQRAAQPQSVVLEAAEVSAAAVRSYLDVGGAAVSAGAVPTGIDHLRCAVAAVGAVGDAQLAGLAQLTLATALIHTMGGRGADVEALLHSALTAVERTGDAKTAAAACASFGFLAVQDGRREKRRTVAPPRRGIHAR